MRWIILLAICSQLGANPADDLIPSTPEEIASLRTDFLIGGYVNPLSGQLSIRDQDLHIQAAQDLILSRTFIPPQLMGKYGDKDAADRLELLKICDYFSNSHIGWVILPHLRCGVYPNSSHYFQISDPNGFTLLFRFEGTRGVLVTPAYGMTNLNGEEVSSAADLRNTQLTVDDTTAHLTTPSGIQRIYRKIGYMNYQLEKEILPNGKAIHYQYHDLWRMTITSTDANDKYVYASIEKNNDHCIASDGTEAIYNYEIRELKGEKKSKKKGFLPRDKESKKERFRLLSNVINPFFPNTIQHNHRTLLTGYDSQAFPIHCEYTTQKNVPAQVSRLSLPDGNGYSFSYDRPIAGQKGGATIVTQPNGSHVVYRFDHRLLLVAIENWDGALINQKRFHYDEKQHVSKIEMLDGSGNALLTKKFVCDECGNPLVETWEGDFGTFTTKRSFSLNRIIKEEREDGLSYEYTYLGSTHLVTSKTTLVAGKTLRKTTYEYDDACNLIQIKEEGRTITTYARRSEAPHLHRIEVEEKKDWDGHLLSKVRYSYDQWGNVAKEEVYGSDDKLAYVIEKTYNQRGDLLTETNPLGQIAKYQYDGRGRLIHKIPFAQYPVMTWEYDAKGRVTRVCEDDHVTTYTYNALDQVIQKRDYLGFTTEYTYDRVHGKPTEINSPPMFTRIVYDAFGREHARIDAYENKTITCHNAYGSPTSITLPSGGRRNFEYANNGDLVKQVDADGIATIYTRDPLGRVTSKKTGKAITLYEYDAYDLIKETNSEGIVSKFTYDSLGRKVKENIAGRITEFTYNPLGFLASEKRKDQVILYKRDLLGRLLEESKSGQLITSWTYDPAGNIATKTLGDATSSYIYDAYNRLIQKMDPIGAITSISYEEENQILTKLITDSRGVTTLEAYDPHGLLLFREVSDIQLQEFDYDRLLRKIRQDHLTFSYTPEGNLASLTEADSRTTEYTYTPEGRIKSKQRPDGTILFYEYDSQGYLSKIHELEFKHDTLGRLIRGTGFQRTLDSFGNILKESFANGLSIESEYDDWDRPLKRILSDKSSIEYLYEKQFLKTITRKDSLGKRLYIHSYGVYDPAGRVLEESHHFPVKYVYDKTGRQLSRKDAYFTESCRYDSVGNLLEKNDTKYTYDDLSQITSESGQFNGVYDGYYNRIEWNGDPIAIDALNHLESETYDANGYLLREGYSYDVYGRLVKAKGKTYTYDALDRRLTKGSISYLYLDNQEIGAADQKGYIQLQVPGLNNSVAIEVDKVSYIPIYDVQGTIRKLVDWKTGKLYAENDADCFGNNSNPYIPYSYAGKGFDPETGLFYFGKRFYDPTIGRWLTPDPIGPVDASNLYQYDFNNPFRYVDKDGQIIHLLLPLLILGAEIALPALPVVMTYVVNAAVAGAVVYGLSEGVQALNKQHHSSHYSSQEMHYRTEKRKKSGSVDPTLSEDPLNDPNLEDISHPEAKENGHYTLKDKSTGKIIKYDPAKPGEPGHKGKNHYHYENPNQTGKRDWYLDSQGNPVPHGSDPSHIYPPGWVWWN